MGLVARSRPSHPERASVPATKAFPGCHSRILLSLVPSLFAHTLICKHMGFCS